MASGIVVLEGAPASVSVTFRDITVVAHDATPYVQPTCDEKKISFLLVHTPHPDAYDLAYAVSGCRCCATRFSKLHCISGKNGPVLLSAKCLDTVHAIVTDPKIRDIYIRLSEMAEATSKTQPINHIILTRGTKYLFNMGPSSGLSDDKTKTYYHWYAKISDDVRTKVCDYVSDYIAHNLSLYFSRFPITMFDDMMLRLSKCDIDHVRTLSKSLDSVVPVYSTANNLKGAALMLCEIVDKLAQSGLKWDDMTFNDKYAFVISNVVNCMFGNRYCDVRTTRHYGMHETIDVFLRVYDNLLDILEITRFDPSISVISTVVTKRVTSKPPADYNFYTLQKLNDTAIEYFGKFTNTAMPFSVLHLYSPATILHQIVPYIPPMPVGKPFGPISRLSDFVSFCRANPAVPIFIDASHTVNRLSGYIAITNMHLSRKFLIPATSNHLWSISNSVNSLADIVSVKKDNPFIPVLATVLMYKYTMPYNNVLFALQGATLNTKNKYGGPRSLNCCHSAFLRPEHANYSNVFESLNQTNITIPDEPIVAGIVSSILAGNVLDAPIRLLINGELHILTHL